MLLWVGLGIVAWLVVATVAALVIGRCAREADRFAQATQVGAARCPSVDVQVLTHVR